MSIGVPPKIRDILKEAPFVDLWFKQVTDNVNDLSGGAITPSSIAATGNITTSGGSIGYATGAGGTVTQITSKSTGVTLNKTCGSITMASGSLANNTNVKFTLTNSKIASTDVLIVNHASGGTAGVYQVSANNITNGTADISLRNVSGGALNEQPVISFAIIKAVTS